MTIEWILGLVAALFGGLNIFQVIFWRQERQKMKAEADSASIDAMRKDIELQNSQFEFMRQKADEAQKDYFEQHKLRKEESEKYLEEMKAVREESAKYLEEMTEMRKELAELKQVIAELKEISCVVIPCGKRVKGKTTKKAKEEKE